MDLKPNHKRTAYTAFWTKAPPGRKKNIPKGIFVVGERIHNVKFNMNAQTWLLIHYWLFLLEYFFSSQGGPWSKRLCRPYTYVDKSLLIHRQTSNGYYCEDLDSVDSFCVLKLFYVEELKQ